VTSSGSSARSICSSTVLRKLLGDVRLLRDELRDLRLLVEDLRLASVLVLPLTDAEAAEPFN